MNGSVHLSRSGSGQERIVAATRFYGWLEDDYGMIDIPCSERAWRKGDRIFFARLGGSGRVLSAWFYIGGAEDRAARTRGAVIAAVKDGQNKAVRAVELLAAATPLGNGDRVRHGNRSESGVIVQSVAALTPNEMRTSAPGVGIVQVLFPDGVSRIPCWEYRVELSRA